MSVPYNAQLIAKLLDLAGHANTCDAEALSSLRKAYRLVGAGNKSLGDVVRLVDAEYFCELISTPHDLLMDQMANLTMERDGAVKKMKAAQAESNALKTEKVLLADKYGRAFKLISLARARRKTIAVVHEAKAAEAIVEDTGYASLKKAVLARRDVGSYWRDMFMLGTGTDKKTMNAWKKSGEVPDWAFGAVPQLDAEGYVIPRIRNIAQRTAVEKAEKSRYFELLSSGLLTYQIVSIMSKEFGRAYSIVELRKHIETAAEAA